MFSLDPSYRRPDGAAVVVGGSPLTIFRLAPAGVRVAEAIEAGRALPPGHEPLTSRLVAAGAIHPSPDGTTAGASELTVVMPAYGSVPRSVPRRCATIVVDDASATAIIGDIAHRDGLRVVRHPDNRGPGAARNTGLAAVTTAWVAFVDSDVDVDEATLLRLVAYAQRVRAALVAPRVCAPAASPVAGARERYERVRSPLDLGPVPARIAPGTRVSYVPAAVLVCRVDALRAVGGFDERLRFGEDVDLVWRLVARGDVCRYEPSCTAQHLTRPDTRSWLRQRFDYGTSAAPLARRHPGAVAPVRTSGWSVATWGAVAVGHPVVGAMLAVGTALALVRKLRDLPARESLRLAALGHLYAGRLLAERGAARVVADRRRAGDRVEALPGGTDRRGGHCDRSRPRGARRRARPRRARRAASRRRPRLRHRCVGRHVARADARTDRAGALVVAGARGTPRLSAARRGSATRHALCSRVLRPARSTGHYGAHVSVRLSVDEEAWRAHVQSVVAAVDGLVPVVKGNGYGFGRRRLFREAVSFADEVAVGTTAEAVSVGAGDVQPAAVTVLTPTLQVPARHAAARRADGRLGRPRPRAPGCRLARTRPREAALVDAPVRGRTASDLDGLMGAIEAAGLIAGRVHDPPAVARRARDGGRDARRDRRAGCRTSIPGCRCRSATSTARGLPAAARAAPAATAAAACRDVAVARRQVVPAPRRPRCSTGTSSAGSRARATA